MSKRRVLADHDTANRDSPSPSPGTRVLGFRPTTTPRGRGGSSLGAPGSAGALSPSTAGGGRAKVDLSTMAFADAANANNNGASPSLRRAPASTPYVASTASLSSSTSSPALRGVAMTASSSAPTTPRIGPPQSQATPSSSVRSPSPNKQLRGSPFERGEIPPTVTVRSASKMSASLRARAGATTDSVGSGMTSSVSMTSGLASPPVSNSGRASPVRVAGHSRSNTLGRVPTAASLHATPTQARMVASSVFSPPTAASPISPSLPRPRSFVAPRPGSPSRPASPPLASQGSLHARHSASEGQEASKRLSRPPLAPGYHQKQHSMSSSSVSGLSSTQSAYSMAAPRSSIGSDLTNGSRSPVSPSPAAGPSSPPRSPGTAKAARAQTQQAFAGHANAREQPSFGSAAATAQAGPPPASNGFFDWAFSAASPPALSPTRPTPASAAASSSASSSTASQGAAPLLSPTSNDFPAAHLSSSASTSQNHLSLPIEYAQLRKERKIADLEITNKSLMAINSGLEVAKHRQAREIRELKRRLAMQMSSVDGGASSASSGMRSPGTDGEEYDDEDEEDDDYFPSMGDDLGPPKEDPELEAAHQRCRAMIDGMINEARGALLSVWPPLPPPADATTKGLAVNGSASSVTGVEGEAGGGGGMKVLSLGEVHEREEEAARAEEEGDEADASRAVGEESLDAGMSADTSLLTETATASPALTRQPSSSQLLAPSEEEPAPDDSLGDRHEEGMASTSTPAEWAATGSSSSPLRSGNGSARANGKAAPSSPATPAHQQDDASSIASSPSAAAVETDGNADSVQAGQHVSHSSARPSDGADELHDTAGQTVGEEEALQTATPRLGDTATLAAAAIPPTSPVPAAASADEDALTPSDPAATPHMEAAPPLPPLSDVQVNTAGDGEDEEEGGATPLMGGKRWLATDAAATATTSATQLETDNVRDGETGDESSGGDTSGSYEDDDDNDDDDEGDEGDGEGSTVTPDISID